MVTSYYERPCERCGEPATSFICFKCAVKALRARSYEICQREPMSHQARAKLDAVIGRTHNAELAVVTR